ncbi:MULTISPECIES: PhoH family protein [Dictyoglomus]|jgi:phosphate starvation-inducible PhoH-like protein|uniref:PhoH-like protein n=1 Tax=Dictyoglomus turgidum (strain DSM 6724 / Z-1310) TaxID=515635 RepID=B8E0F8_DICTD|nr:MULTISPECIES: PhoH family protein [Dictyoglomus]ACK42603.1 PhoH family protein [Dictyoglomus turgidum DSM 6724]PNV80485.1 MAG: PhoH family protein [Dictyoglomus turgidum]HBU31170.1 PhoH family protein [Dictyoglomus sp.]
MERSLLRTEIIIPKDVESYREEILNNIEKIEEIDNVKIKVEDNKLVIYGEPESVKRVEAFLLDQISISKKSGTLLVHKVLVFDKKIVRILTPGQKNYVEEIEKNYIVLAKGPAGTGKSFLAIAVGLNMLKNNLVQKMILTRPVVEAGEKLGFLPGDIQQKVDPYIRPLYDFLEELLGSEKLNKYIEKGMIEVAPLAYMRGRTFKYSFILLDEAQNTTPMQMKMFLTRFGEGSKMVVTGDVTQTDLDVGRTSGLTHAWEILRGIKGIGFVELTEKDVVRHDIVKEIIKAYERWEINK